MTRRIPRIAALLLVLVLAGCGRVPSRGAQVKVVASIAPLADWARKVGGARVSVQLIVPPGVDPRRYELTPQQRAVIRGADLVLMNGLGLEPWIEDVLDGARSSRLIVAEMSQFTGPLTERVPQKRSHEPDAEPARPRADAAGETWKTAPIYSRYLWLDVSSARTQVDVIAQMLARAEPESMVDFRQNAARYTGELDNLDGSLFRQIEHWPWRTILSTDRFLFPFARHHGLSIAIFGAPVRRGGPPLAQPLFVDALTAREVRSVELSGRQMVLLDPLGKSDYIDLMQTMVQSMTSAMEAHEK